MLFRSGPIKTTILLTADPATTIRPEAFSNRMPRAGELSVVQSTQSRAAASAVRFFCVPRIFKKARHNCKKISAYARSCRPQAIQSRLLRRNNQNPQFLFNLLCEATNHAAITVTNIAGHWIAFNQSITRPHNLSPKDFTRFQTNLHMSYQDLASTLLCDRDASLH